jgi:hypothetical protein
MFDISDFIHENPVNYLAIVRQPSSESGYLPPERLRGAFDAQNAIEFVPLAETKLQGEIVIHFLRRRFFHDSFAVALYGFMENQGKEGIISPSSSLLLATEYDIIGVYNHYAGQDVRYRHLRNAVEYHLCQDELPPNLNQLVPTERSVRDGLDVWTLAGGELVHVAVKRDIDPRLGFLGCARILAGTCWETHIKALADWGPLTSGSLD